MLCTQPASRTCSAPAPSPSLAQPPSGWSNAGPGAHLSLAGIRLGSDSPRVTRGLLEGSIKIQTYKVKFLKLKDSILTLLFCHLCTCHLLPVALQMDCRPRKHTCPCPTWLSSCASHFASCSSFQSYTWAPKCHCPGPGPAPRGVQPHPPPQRSFPALAAGGHGGSRDEEEKDAGVPIFTGNRALPASWPSTYLTLHIAVKCLLASSTFGQSFFP